LKERETEGGKVGCYDPLARKFIKTKGIREFMRPLNDDSGYEKRRGKKQGGEFSVGNIVIATQLQEKLPFKEGR